MMKIDTVQPYALNNGELKSFFAKYYIRRNFFQKYCKVSAGFLQFEQDWKE